MAITVEAWELQYHDSGANSHKFYRLYALGSEYVVQWGRVGTVGQFKRSPGNRWAARQQSDSKEMKGYQQVGGTWTFDVPNAQVAGPDLHRYFEDTRRGTPVQSPTARRPSVAPTGDEMTPAELKAEADFKAMLVKMAGDLSDHPAAPTVAAAPAPDDNSMEARLAAAIAKAKAKAKS